VVNVITHGLESVENGWVEFHLTLGGGHAVLIFRDPGPPFDPTVHEPCDIPLDSEDRLPGGLGIELMLQMMDEVRYQRADQVNALVMTRQIK
jgi:serine/threonine-protein kinase RsbW